MLGLGRIKTMRHLLDGMLICHPDCFITAIQQLANLHKAKVEGLVQVFGNRFQCAQKIVLEDCSWNLVDVVLQ